jgi:hypothetical protein
MDNWARIKAIFEAALELPPEERSAFVARECEQQPEMEPEVRQLLADHEAAGDFWKIRLPP